METHDPGNHQTREREERGREEVDNSGIPATGRRAASLPRNPMPERGRRRAVERKQKNTPGVWPSAGDGDGDGDGDEGPHR